MRLLLRLLFQAFRASDMLGKLNIEVGHSQCFDALIAILVALALLTWIAAEGIL